VPLTHRDASGADWSFAYNQDDDRQHQKTSRQAPSPYLFCLLALLTGCSLQPIQGDLQIRDNRPLPFATRDQQTLLTPGKAAVFIADAPASASSFRLKHASGEIRIPTRPEDFTHNHFRIDRAVAGTSTDLRGVWREQTLQVMPVQEFEQCTAPGLCPQLVEVLICPDKGTGKHGDGCRRHFETQLRYAWNCPGLRPVENTYQTYTVSLELEFVDTVEASEPLARFSGTSTPRKRVVTHRDLGPCVVQ